MNDSGIGDLVEALKTGREVLVVTGAGVSHASGIPTFRGTDAKAVWANSVMSMATYAYFAKDPAGSWRWYLDRFSGLHDKLPNPGHTALVDIEGSVSKSGRGFLLVTQNIDTLHEKAGSFRMAKVHGSADRARCSNDGCANAAPLGSVALDEISFTAFEAASVAENLPRCAICKSFMRPHILWFDESYTEHRDYQFEKVCSAADRASVALFIGTSFAVGITEMILESCRGRSPVWSIDPSGRTPNSWVRSLDLKSEEVLPQIATLISSG